MQFLSSDGLNEDYFDDEEDAEGEPDESQSSESSEEESSEAASDEDVRGASHSTSKGKERDLGEAGETEEVDQDFDRLVSDIRSGDAASATLSKVWDFDMRDRETEFKDDLREASGVGKKRGRKPGRRKGIILSQQVRALIGEGNQAYVDNNIAETIRIMEEVIRIEPRAGSAWSVLAQCHEDTGELQKALRLRVIGAHMNQDPEEWYRLADQSRRLGYHQQALYCYRKLYQVDPSNITALWDRASLAREIGELRTARQALLSILKHVPHDLTVLAELRPILIELSDLALCASLFQDAFTHYQAAFPTGEVSIPTQDPSGAPVGFGLMEVLVLADLYNTLAKYDAAVHTIRQGCRWLQGRAAQKFWDAIEDDREWDVLNPATGEGARVVSEGEVQPGMYLLDVNARHRLAIARIKMGDISEGRMHANIVLSQDITEYAPLFSEIADAYFEREMYAEAGHIYEMLGADAGTSSLYVLLQAAACRRMMGDIKEAAEVYEHVIKADPTHNDAKMKLAEIYEILNEPRKALDLVLQVIDSRRKPRLTQDDRGADSTSVAGPSLFEERPRQGKEKAVKTPAQKAGKLSVAQLKELEMKKEQEAALSYGRVKGLWTRMLAGEETADKEWMHEAESLVESFRETRALFLTTRHVGFRGMFPRSRRRKQSDEANEDSMASRLQLELGRDSLSRKSKVDGTSSQTLDSFRKISFDDWLRLFMQYTFNLTKRGQYDDAQDILRHVIYSNAFQKRTYQDSIRCALMTCSIAADRPDVVVEQSRKLINSHQYNNEPLRLLLASLSSGLRNTDAFLASTLTKHLLREVKANDTALKNPEALKWNPVLKRYGVGNKVDEDEDDAGAEPTPVTSVQDAEVQPRPPLPTKENPVGVALYGQICLAAKSYQSALFYLLHAYDYCPHDPLICLCLAIASIGRAMQRQADNRHHLITQGLAFLSKYRSIRGEDSVALDEIEFNFGRAFHQLGLFTLAAKHYTRALDIVESRLKVSPEEIGVAREAAYNLSMIYVTTGDTPLAQRLYRRWLSL